MSYILDALRKSEQERQLAAGKGASVLYPVMVESRRSSTPMLLMAGVAVGAFVVAGLAYWLLRSQPPAPSAPAPMARIADTAVPPARSSAMPVTPSAPPVPTAEPPAQGAASRAPMAPSVREKPRSAPVAVAATPVVEPQAPELRKDDLPPIAIMGYIRDGEQGGMVMINDKLVREGEEFAPGLRLEKILPDGAVFSFKGRRFTR